MTLPWCAWSAKGRGPPSRWGPLPTSRHENQLLAIGFPRTGLYVDAGDEPPLQVRLGHRLTNIPIPADMLATPIRGSGGDSGGPLFDLGGRLVGTMTGSGRHAPTAST